MQEGARKQPDYIVCYRRNGTIGNLEKAKEVSKQFELHSGKALPIIVIDEDKIRLDAVEIINRKIREYKTNPSEELGNEIYRIALRIENYDRDFSETLFKNTENRKIYDSIRSQKIRSRSHTKSQMTILQNMEEYHSKSKSDDTNQFKVLHENIYSKIHKEDRDA